MKTLKIKDLTIGDGIPKVCIPITAETSDEIIAEASKALTANANMVMLRMDYMNDLLDSELVIKTIQRLRHLTIGLPLIIDLRTQESGANISLNHAAIRALMLQIIMARVADIIRIDDRLEPSIQNRIKGAAHQNGIKIITEHFYLMQHPTQEQLMQRMNDLGQSLSTDMIEVSTIPRKKEQVLDLMQACLKSSRKLVHPIIIDAMGPLGKTIQVASKSCNNSIIYEPLQNANYLGQLSIAQISKLNSML